MKPKYLPLVFTLLMLSCKVTEKNVVGFYQDDNFGTLKLNSDNTFIYTNFDLVKMIIKKQDYDSCRFVTKGKWQLIDRDLILNSYTNSFTDTGRVRKIIKTPASSKKSNFSFIDMNGNAMNFYSIDDEKGNFAYILDRTYWDYNVDLAKHKRLTFHFQWYKPWTFNVTDTTNANYKITLSPIIKALILIIKSLM